MTFGFRHLHPFVRSCADEIGFKLCLNRPGLCGGSDSPKDDDHANVRASTPTRECPLALPVAGTPRTDCRLLIQLEESGETSPICVFQTETVSAASLSAASASARCLAGMGLFVLHGRRICRSVLRWKSCGFESDREGF